MTLIRHFLISILSMTYIICTKELISNHNRSISASNSIIIRKEDFAIGICIKNFFKKQENTTKFSIELSNTTSLKHEKNSHIYSSQVNSSIEKCSFDCCSREGSIFFFLKWIK
jgi:hypothetical protein